jgi:hypothetical protein
VTKTKQQFLLGKLAKRIEKNVMTPEDWQYLVSSMYALSRGEDARKIFKTAKAKGAREERLEATYRKKMAITLIAAYIRPKYQNDSDFSIVMPSGVGLSEKEAIDKAYAFFKVEGGKSISTNDDYYISYATLEHYWREAKKKNPELLRPHFLHSDTLPD